VSKGRSVIRSDSLATATVVASSVLGNVLADVASIVVETVAASGVALGGPSSVRDGIVSGETAIASGRCEGCQF
jgi:hypothetical protein